MNRKRFIKLLMAQGLTRNEADDVRKIWNICVKEVNSQTPGKKRKELRCGENT